MTTHALGFARRIMKIGLDEPDEPSIFKGAVDTERWCIYLLCIGMDILYIYLFICTIIMVHVKI